MTSQARLNANRQNARQSTGPRTPEGKAAAAQNALTHGLTAARLVLRDEDRDAFDQLHADMLDAYAPAGPVERMLADRITALTWRLRRAEQMETAVLDVLSRNENAVWRVNENRHLVDADQFNKLNWTLHEARESAGTVKFRNAVSQLHQLLYPIHPSQPHTVLGCIAIEDFSDSGILERLLRYQGQIERSLYKAMDELQKIQDRRISRQRQDQITPKKQNEPTCQNGNPPQPKSPQEVTEQDTEPPQKNQTQNCHLERSEILRTGPRAGAPNPPKPAGPTVLNPKTDPDPDCEPQPGPG